MFSHEEFLRAKNSTLLNLKCQVCCQHFSISKKRIVGTMSKCKRGSADYCSVSCRISGKKNMVTLSCKSCDKKFERQQGEVNKTTNGMYFCTQSCAASYINKHKTHGTRRSKLEKWLETQLTVLYPELEIRFNQNDTVGSELDIYIPSLKFAFELNGIFHYKPIYGEEKLSKTQNNDQKKFQACLEHGIELYQIDTSRQKYFTEKSSQRYFVIISSLIEKKLSQQSYI